MTEEKKPVRYKRKEMFSNPRVQLRILMSFGFLALLFIATNCYISKQLLSNLGEQVLQLPLSANNQADLVLILEQQGRNVALQLALFIFLSVFVLLMAGVVLSHRIGGPIYQLTKYLDEMSRDAVKPRRIKFRKSDFFGKLATTFNTFQESRGIVPPAGEEKKK